MKLILAYLLLLLLLLAGQPAMSQKGFSAGPLIGLNGIHIEGNNEVLYNTTDGTIWGTGGYSYGVFVSRDFKKHMYWEMQLIYIQKGSIYDFINTYGRQDFEIIRINYIELPLLVGYKLNLRRKTLYVETGLALAKLLNKNKFISEYSEGLDRSLLEEFNDFDISWIAKAKLPLNKKETLFAGVRFSYSILTIHSVYKLYNMVYGIELNYTFN